MKRIAYLVMAALLALVILVPTAMANEHEMMDESMMMEQSKMEEPKMMEKGKMEQGKMMEKKGKMEMPKTGGPSPGLLLLPAAALLVGMGLMAGYIVRRRS